ncbi:hypothetical protein FF1_019064 [Malus domestica]
MNFFKSIFFDDPLPSNNLHSIAQNNGVDPNQDWERDHSPRPNYSTGAWSFEGLICNDEFESELKKETAVIWEVASYAIKDLLDSLEVSVSMAHDKRLSSSGVVKMEEER